MFSSSFEGSFSSKRCFFFCKKKEKLKEMKGKDSKMTNEEDQRKK